MTKPRVRYFAYGSNMLTARLHERVPSATPIGIGQLEGHALRWDKRSWRDGSGKCDAAPNLRANGPMLFGVLSSSSTRKRNWRLIKPKVSATGTWRRR